MLNSNSTIETFRQPHSFFFISPLVSWTIYSIDVLSGWNYLTLTQHFYGSKVSIIQSISRSLGSRTANVAEDYLNSLTFEWFLNNVRAHTALQKILNVINTMKRIWANRFIFSHFQKLPAVIDTQTNLLPIF